MVGQPDVTFGSGGLPSPASRNLHHASSNFRTTQDVGNAESFLSMLRRVSVKAPFGFRKLYNVLIKVSTLAIFLTTEVFFTEMRPNATC